MIELLPEIGNLVAVFGFQVFALLVEVELNLAQCLQTADEIVMEDAEVRERFRLAFLL